VAALEPFAKDEAVIVKEITSSLLSSLKKAK